MSKRYGKPGQTNPNRAISRNNSGGKRNGPKTDWSEHSKNHRLEGQRFIR